MSVATASILGPLVAAALIVLMRRAVAGVALAGIGVSFVAAAATLARVATGERFTATWPGLPGLPLRLNADPFGSLLSAVVAAAGLFVFVYAIGYMRGDADLTRFYAAMSFFVAAMQALVLAGDWLLFIAAWELIALASYVLIGFWFQRAGVAQAATRAFLVTRAADLGLYLGVIALVTTAGTSEIGPTLRVDGRTATIAGLLLLIAAMGKAAQVPLHGWLQDAMAGPTPVSALLHSATLVVAGVVLLARVLPLLPSEVRLTLGIVGGATAVVAGLSALAQGDLKRMLAASTSAQLGLMLVGLGAGSLGAATFHLVTNAAVKSSLFLGAGIFQHARGSTRFEKLSGIGRERRRLYMMFALAALALAGVPPLAAFWSKDAIIVAALDASHAWLLAPLALVGSGLTGAYVARALRLLWEPAAVSQRSEPVLGLRLMVAVVATLATGVVALGAVGRPIGRLLDVRVAEALSGALLSLGVTAAGLAWGWHTHARPLPATVAAAAERNFRVGAGLTDVVVRPALAIARLSDRVDRGIQRGVILVGRFAVGMARATRRVDDEVHRGVVAVGTASIALADATRVTDERGIDDGITVLARSTVRLGGRARRLQTGLVHRELLLAAVGAAAMLVLVLWR